VAKDRLNREDLIQLNWMSEIKRRLAFEHKAVEVYLELWKNEKLTEKKIDTQIPHEINLETGIIRMAEDTRRKPKIEEDGTKGN